MKAKALKYYRKHWEYRFREDGKVLCRNKNSNRYVVYNSIAHLVSWYASSDRFGPCIDRRWRLRKAMIASKKQFDKLPVLPTTLNHKN